MLQNQLLRVPSSSIHEWKGQNRHLHLVATAGITLLHENNGGNIQKLYATLTSIYHSVVSADQYLHLPLHLHLQMSSTHTTKLINCKCNES